MFSIPKHNIPSEVREYVTDEKLKEAIKGTYKAELKRMKKSSGIKKFSPEQSKKFSDQVKQRMANFLSSQFKMPITVSEIEKALQ